MQQIINFTFFFGSAASYELKSDELRAILEEELQKAIRAYYGLNPDGSFDKNKKFGYVDPARAPKNLNYGIIPSLFVGKVLTDYKALIIRSSFYEQAGMFTVDFAIPEEEIRLLDEGPNEIFSHFFDRYDWPQYNIARVFVQREEKLEDYIESCLED